MALHGFLLSIILSRDHLLALLFNQFHLLSELISMPLLFLHLFHDLFDVLLLLLLKLLLKLFLQPNFLFLEFLLSLHGLLILFPLFKAKDFSVSEVPVDFIDILFNLLLSVVLDCQLSAPSFLLIFLFCLFIILTTQSG